MATTTPTRPCRLIRLGCVPLPEIDDEMRRRQQARMADEIIDTLIFVEHPEIVTIGRRAQVDGTPPPAGYAFHNVDRGGGITWHGPGQLTVYPIFAWRETKPRGKPKLPGDRSVGGITTLLEEWIIQSLETLGVTARRDDRMRGAWIGEAKIASIGLAFSRWVSRHGLTINYDTPTTRVEALACCGLSEGTTSSIATATGIRLSREQIEQALLEKLEPVLCRRLEARVR